MPFVKFHLPCHDCGGSDPVSQNDDGSAYCFSCNTYFKDYGTSEVQPQDTVTDFTKYQASGTGSGSSYNALTDRGISIETAKKYGVKSTTLNGKVTSHHYPYFHKGEEVATKIRKLNKQFAWTGNSKETGLFGEQLFKAGGKFITVVEGECDAMAAYELLGSKWPVVSIKSGAQGGARDVKNSLEFLESFDTVVLCFDSDNVGKDGAKAIAKLLTPNKAKLMTLPEGFKDPNDMLKEHKHSMFVNCFWDAKVYTPSGIMNLSSQLDEYKRLRTEKLPSIPYPWGGLNKKLEGMRAGELVTLTGGTGLGKSSVTRELEHWLINHTKDNVGIVALEENWSRTAEGIMAVEANSKLHLDSVKNKIGDDRLEQYYRKVFMGENEGRVWIHAHLGVNNLEDIFSKLRYLIVGLDCKWVVVDHLHMLVLQALEGDERKAIDGIMHRLRSLVEETGAGMILVSHLRRVEGNRGHENGIETGLSHLRGSQSIAQLSDCVISLERNQQSEDEIEASTTKVRVLKSRYTGDVGVACSLLYDADTGRLREINDGDNYDAFDGDEL
jgi:twinkle protein